MTKRALISVSDKSVYQGWLMIRLTVLKLAFMRRSTSCIQRFWIAWELHENKIEVKF